MLFVQGFTLVQFPFLTGVVLPIVVDLYCPFTIEHLEQTCGDAHALRGNAGRHPRRPERAARRRRLLHLRQRTQRDFWLGDLHSRGRINPLTYAADPTLRRLIDVVPFGLQDEPFAHAARTRPARPATPGP